MNWFQRLINNPNAHIIGAIASGAASVAFPAYAPALQAVAGALGVAGVALPEQPAPVPIVNLPPAVAGGSLHAVDYAALAASLIEQFATKKP